ncbi:hypothetical protein ACWF9G_25010 [Nocardia sp. NPDC055029]|uniref:hypothetical protein n=1 Tax=Nocardia sp. NPDC060259 TaxID=3347088 RepID=UPI00365A90FD
MFFGPEPGWNETVAMVLIVGVVVYGLLLGLIAAATHESYDADLPDRRAGLSVPR